MIQMNIYIIMKGKIWWAFSVLSFWSLMLQAQNELPPKEAFPFSVRQIHSGHSLTDPLFHPWPGQYVNLVGLETGQWAGDHIGKSTIPGSPMWWRWENPTSPDARHDIHEWELLSITEGVPLNYTGGSNHQWYIEGIDSQRVQLSRFVNNAWVNGNHGYGAPTMLWTTWTNIDDSDGPWRAMLDTLGTEWENMQDYANAHRPDGAPYVYMIPGHRMMARLFDDIQLGLVPGVTDISYFFSDNIHVNVYGSYAVALIHYSCIFNQSPVGLTNDLENIGAGTNFPVPSEDLAAYLQHMIWEVVTTYSRTGVQATTSLAGFDHKGTSHTIMEVFPNPASDIIDVRIYPVVNNGSQSFIIYNELGQEVLRHTSKNGEVGYPVQTYISVSHLAPGWYILQYFSDDQTVTQRLIVLPR